MRDEYVFRLIRFVFQSTDKQRNWISCFLHKKLFLLNSLFTQTFRLGKLILSFLRHKYRQLHDDYNYHVY